MLIICPHCGAQIEKTPKGICSACGQPYIGIQNEDDSGFHSSDQYFQTTSESDTPLIGSVSGLFSGLGDAIGGWFGGSSDSDSQDGSGSSSGFSGLFSSDSSNSGDGGSGDSGGSD